MDIFELRNFLNKCRQIEQKTERENPDPSNSTFFRMNEMIINFFVGKIEQELDGRTEPGAIDFKIFILERYFFSLSTKKDNKEIQKRYFALIRKYLRNETEDIGANKFFLMFSHYEKISEQYYRTLNEILIFLNDNIQRINEIWDININFKPERNKIKNSLELLYAYANPIISYCRKFYANKNEKHDNSNISSEVLQEFYKQEKNLIDNMGKMLSFFKKVKEETIDDNHKGIVLEKFLIFLYQIFHLFLRLKSAKGLKMTKEEAQTLCRGSHFMIKIGTISALYDNGLRYFWDLISSGYSSYANNQAGEQNNYFYEEFFSDWKKYFNFEEFLVKKYVSEAKINSVINIFLKLYNFCFLENSTNHILFKDMQNRLKEDNYNIIKKLIERLNDFEVSFDIKANIINLIYNFINFRKDNITFEELYFIAHQLTNFFKVLYNLNKNEDLIGIFLKEEKQIQKNNYQKDMVKINLENKEENNLVYKRYNLNGIFYNLTKSKYDKYMFIKESKILFEILKSKEAAPQNHQHFSAHDVISKLIELFKNVLKQKEYTSDIQKKSYTIDKISNILSKLFFYYFYIYEKLKVNHQIHEQTDQKSILDLYISEFTNLNNPNSEENNENYELFVALFTKLMPYIFKLYKHGLNICPTKSCISAKLVHNIFKTIKNERAKEKVFQIYFEFFGAKIFETGNPAEIFDTEMNNSSNNNVILNESINNITILKSIFFNLLECIVEFSYFKNSIIPLIIDILYLSKNSEYYGNYIYILRCFFKYLKTAITQFNSLMPENETQQRLKQSKKKLSDDFNIEINYILYAILKYLVNIKEKAPFFNEMITEIIMILPVKQRFLIEIPHLIFPSLVDNLVNGSDNIQLNLINLENWMNVYIKNAESVVPFIQQNLSKITDLLSANLLSSTNINICLASLKWLSKLGGKGRNYFKEKRIISKTCPMQILTMKLKEKKENRNMDFVLDYIIDIDIDNCINWSSKTMHKKSTTNADKKLIFNYVEIYKNCLAAFFHKKIDYNYILEIKKNIINGVKDFNEKEFNSDFSFRQMNQKNSKIKINNFFRKKEHFIIGKIITGYFLINSSYIQIQNLQKDDCFLENDLMQFISNNFLMILLSKEKNNKNMLLFEQDPILFLDEIIQFLFSSHPTIIKNTNVQLTEYSLKIINNIIESLNNFFDNDNNIIKNLEIVDIIYMKFLNCCYTNDSPKIDLGLMLIKVLLQKFDKCINFKYLKYFFRSISSVTSNYSNIVNIQFKKGSNNLVEVIELLINIFIINDTNYDTLTPDNFDIEKNEMIIKENITQNEKTKNNFIMLFEFVKYCFDEVVEKIDSENNYTRNVGIYFFNKVVGKIPRMKHLIPYLMQLDVNNFNIKDFISYFKKAKQAINYKDIISRINNNKMNEENMNEKNIEMNKNINYILPNFDKKKIYKKLDNIFNTLTKKLGLRENTFTYLITCSDALNKIFDISPCLIEEYIFSKNINSEDNKVDLYLEVIQSLYFNILISYYNYCQISIYFKHFTETFKSRLIFLFMEQLLVDKNLEHDYEIYIESNKKIIIKNKVENENIKYIENFIKENSIYRNEVNTRDHIIAELFENLSLKINMVVNYIKLLSNMFTNFKNHFTKEIIKENQYSIYSEYKKKITQLIFLQILNLHTASIIKQCSKFMCDIFKEDKELKQEIFKENLDKINNLIGNIVIDDIKNSNCALIQDMITKLQKENMTSLLIISKSMGLEEGMITKLTQCIKHFENISEKDFENSQIVLFYGYISIFLYIDVSNDKTFINAMFNQILKRYKEKMAFPSKNLLTFTKTKYSGNVVKLITKYRKDFAEFVINKAENKENNSKNENKYIIELIKTLIENEHNNLICETLFKEITNEFKNKIIYLNREDDFNNSDNLIKIAQLLKICRKISSIFRIYIKSTSLLQIIKDYMENLAIFYSKKEERLKSNIIYHKIFKNWIILNTYCIESFVDKKLSMNCLFFYMSLQNMSNIQKNKIEFLLSNQLNFYDGKEYEKNYKSIINFFCSLDTNIKKYFDLYVDILIIPLMISFYKKQNFFVNYNILLNNDLDIDKKENNTDNNNNTEIKEESKIIFDEEYLVNTLCKLTSGLYQIKFKKEKKEESKYKLLILLIVIYKEYLSRKNNNNIFSKKVKEIHYNIQALLNYSPLYEEKNQAGLWRIYLFLGICLFTDQKAKDQEKNLDIIFNFNKKLNDEFSDIQNLTYELILPYSNNEESIENLYKFHAGENPSFIIYFLKIILKFPNIINNSKESLTKELLNNIYEMMGRPKNTVVHKKIFLQIIGLFTLTITKMKKKTLSSEVEKRPNLDAANFAIAYRFYRYIIQFWAQDAEILEILKKLLYYFREMFDNSEKIIFNFEFKYQEFQKLIHVHIQMMRIGILFLLYESLYTNKKNIEHYFIINKFIIDNNINHRIFNDFMLVIRLLSDQDTLYKLNKKEKIHDIYVIDYKRTFMNQFKDVIIKDKNFMKDKFTNYDIKDFFTSNNNYNNYKGTEFYDYIIKKVQKYLIDKKVYQDNANVQNNVMNNQLHNQAIPINQPQQQQLQTLSSTDAQAEIINRNINMNVNIPQIVGQRPPQQQIIPQAISPEKWMETFNIYYFKNFIFYRKFVEDFYVQLPTMIQSLNNTNLINSFQLGNNLNIQNSLNINELKTDLDTKLKMKQDIMDLIYSCTSSYFENFLYFTLFFLQEYNKFYNKNFYYSNPLTKEVKEYFSSTHNFFYNMRNYEDLKIIKEEQIEIILNDKDKEREQPKNNRKYIFYMLCIYPDIILSSFLFFFNCDEIMGKYYNFLLELFLHTYRYFRDKFYEPLLEYLVKEIMNNKTLKNKPEEKNAFMFNLLKSFDNLNPFKVVRTSENIIMIFKNYLEYYLTEPNFNKKDSNILKSLRIFLYIIAKFELVNRKPIFELIKSYIGKNLIDALKWIFTFDENEIDVYYFIYFETIPLSIDLFLSYFEEDTKLIMNDNNFSKFKNLNKFNCLNENEIDMEIEEKENEVNKTDMEKYDKSNFIKKMVDNCNIITKDKKVSDLLDPIRAIITIENSSYYKIFVVIFAQLWKMLTMTEREMLNMYLNEFFYKYTVKQKDRNNNMIINLLLAAFSQCSPMIYIKPVIIQSLIPYQNFWSTHILYLENLLINGIDVPSTYNSLINIFISLKEDGLCSGLKYYFSDNSISKEGYGELQAGNYLNAEKIFYECFEKFNKEILGKIDNINIDSFKLEDENLELFNELSSWEEGLIECYEHNDNWMKVIEFSERINNNDLKLKGLWHYGSEKWQDLNTFVNDIPQYIKSDRSLERYNLKNSYIIQINEIYSIFKKLIQDNNNDNNTNNKCQTTCMKCIQSIYQNFSSLHPKNLEIIDYYYFLIFQLAVESWESTNTLNDIIKKLKDNNQFNFKDNLLLWRERLPHYCEGFNALRNVLEPRNYLFKNLQNLVANRGNDNAKYLPHYSDKVWTDMIFMKYARKLGLIETFYQKKQMFEEEYKDILHVYPYEIFLKEIECIKLIRNNTFNYDLGIKICDENINKYRYIMDDSNKDFIDYVCNNFKWNKAYFYYKQGNVIQAHNLFTEASIIKNKECTDYHLYNDWGEMCEEIARLTIDSEECSEWFDNTIHNYIYTIIFKLDKAKFIIPRMIDFIKEFEKEKLKNKFNKDLDEIPVWIWLFWLSLLFENLNFYQNNEEKADFFFYILKKVANKYQQMFYYPYKVYSKIMGEKNMINTDINTTKKYEELYKIISAENKYSHFIDKIEIFINELTKKEAKNRENSLNAILSVGENNTFTMDNISNLKEFFKKVAIFLGRFPDLTYFTNDIINLMDSPDVTRKQLREFVIKNKYYIHNLIVTENKYEKLVKLINEKLYNIDFTNIEIPGYFSNKIIEPNEQNKIYISKLESEYSYKLITDARTKVLIRCSNDKLMSFIIENQDADKNIDKRIYLMQILFNFIFEKNYETYKRKVKFYVPIKYFISSKIKIIEEEIYYKYNMDEIYEYCLQKRGYYPHIAYQIFEEEGKKNKLDSNFLYYSEINNEKLFKRMCKILPQDSLKNFIHKFILTSEDILLFRKQFTTSYAINNLMNFIILDNTILKNISFNKETGLCVFNNTDLTVFTDNEYKELKEQKLVTPLRLTKNINYFLNITSIYGIIPGVFNFSCKALLNKPKVLKSILKISLDNKYLYTKVDKIANNYMNKFKYVLNILDDKEYFPKDLVDNNMVIENTNEIKNENNNGNMKNIFELIENSMNDDKLMRKSIDYEAWF